MATAAQEIELKFAVPADQAQAVWRAIAPDASPGRRLVATYFDTDDRRLAAAGYGLRIRDDGKTRVQTLKGPAPEGFARMEYETQLSGPALDLAALADTPASDLLRGAELAPLFTVDVVRSKTVMTQDAAHIEVCLDLGGVDAGGEWETISEIELELLDGPATALFALARRLTSRRPLRLSFESKAERGFRLLDGGRDGPPTITADMDVAAAFTAIGEAALAQIVVAEAALDAEISPKAVHDLRVALRRLRSARSTFKALLSDRESEAVAVELKWLAGALDEMRDLDVLAESAAGVDPAFHGVLEAARGEARDRLRAALATPRRRGLALKIAAWLSAGGWRRTRQGVARRRREGPIVAFAVDALQSRFEKLDPKRDLAAMAPEERHHERIRIKKLRYVAEALAPLFDRPKRRKRALAAYKTAQDALGALNDAAVGRDLAHRLVATSGDAEAAFAAGAAFAPDPRRDAKRLKAAQEAWDEMVGTEGFWR